MTAVRLCILVFWLALSVASHAVGQIPEGWEILSIPTTPGYSDGRPHINDRGQIVFGRRRYPTSDYEIMLYDRGTLTQLTHDNVRDTLPRINNKGEIVWSRDVASDGQQSSIVRWREDRLEVISHPEAPFSDGDADLNDHDQIVWARYPIAGRPTSQIVLFDGGQERSITADTYSNQIPRINQRGHITWTRYDFSQDPWVGDIMLYDAGNVLCLSGGGQSLEFSGLNDAKVVVWGGGTLGLQLWRNGLVRQIAPPDGVPRMPQINNRSDVSYTRTDNAGKPELWLLRGGFMSRIVAGDVGGLRSDINERGEVAWLSGLSSASLRVALLTHPAFDADLDFDGLVTHADFALFRDCFAGPADATLAVCAAADFDDNGTIDLADFAAFTVFFGAP
jgi:hypothetical protein